MKELEEDQKESIKRIISELTDVPAEKIEEHDHLKDTLGLDSLDIIDLSIRIEETFDCNIPDEDYEHVKTVNDVFKIVSNRI